MLSKLFGGGGDAIDVTEAERRATAGEVVLVDVREKGEWKSGARAARQAHRARWSVATTTRAARQADRLHLPLRGTQ